jgi:hypothetical protein
MCEHAQLVDLLKAGCEEVSDLYGHPGTTPTSSHSKNDVLCVWCRIRAE